MTFSIARLFGYTRLLEAELEREREAHAETKRQAAEKERSLIDAVQRAANKPPVFDRPEPPKPSDKGAPLFLGPTLSARKRQEREAEIIEKAAAVKTSNGHNVDAPEIPPA